VLEKLICRADELQLSLQVSVVGMIREEWLAGRVENYQGRGIGGETGTNCDTLCEKKKEQSEER